MNGAKHILLAEDDADDRELFIEAMAMLDPGIQVTTVENGERLIEYLNAATLLPDCIFLDLNMPKKNGKDSLREIRDNARTHHLPVVIYTTSHSTKDIDDTFKRGATCFIRKPSSFKDLQDLLRVFLTSSYKTPNQHRMKGNFVLNPG